MPMIGIAIIGCGAIGKKRLSALNNNESVNIHMLVDLNKDRARALQSLCPEAEISDNWKEALLNKDVSAVCISTPHNALAPIMRAAIESGKHVLIEKPAGCSAMELEGLIELADRQGVLVRVGYNHRYHRAFRKVYEMLSADTLGPLMFIRANYGHGGRLGYDREWRSDPILSGGGELIDQGVHIIDLARSILGEFSVVNGHAQTCYWDMPVDDNAFLTLQTDEKKTAFIHVSCTEWKNTFVFEIYGRKGKLRIDGLGGSYGIERLTFYKMLPEMGPPETFMWEFPMQDDSWVIETNLFIEDIREDRKPSVGLKDAIATLKVVEQIYKESSYVNGKKSS